MQYNSNKESGDLIQLVSFKIEDVEFGIDIRNVQEIIKITEITKMPHAPIFVEGVINLRGKVIPVIDLRKRMGLGKKGHDKNTRIIVVELLDNTTGFIVDEVNEVLRISSNITEAPPEIVAGIDTDFIQSVGKLEERLLIIINLIKIFSKHEKDLLNNSFQ